MGQVASDFTGEYPRTWNSDDVKNWTKSAIQSQKTFYMSFQGRQWDEYQPDEYELLRVKICYALYGPPQDANNNFQNIEEAYTEDQRKNATIIKDKIITLHKESELNDSCQLCVGFLFVMCKKDANEFFVPVFRVRVKKDPKDVNKYIDNTGRVYNSWDNWKTSNVLPMMKYCYPKFGFYTAEDDIYAYNPEKDPLLEFGTTPACAFKSRLGRTFDLASGIGSLASAGIGIGALFIPVAGPVLAVASVVGTSSAIYGGARSVNVLADKKLHSESLTDTESILSILTIIAIPANFAAASANAIVQAGVRHGPFTSFVRLGVTVLSCTTITLDSTMLLVGLVNLIERFNRGELTALDVLQFSISTFFFTHTLIQPIIAHGIVKKAQNNRFNEYEKNLNDVEAKRDFEKFIQENIDEATQVIKKINKIENPDAFFKSTSPENEYVGASANLN